MYVCESGLEEKASNKSGRQGRGGLIYALVGWIELTTAVVADAGDEEITKKAKQTQLFDVVKETRSSRHGWRMIECGAVEDTAARFVS